MPQRIMIYNAPRPTTGAMAKVTTGTALKTMLQIKADRKFVVRQWGIAFDGSAAAAGIQCELIETGTVAATVTAHVESGLIKFSDPDAEAVATVLGISVGTAATGYTSSAEGTVTESRPFDSQIIQPTNLYLLQYPLGAEPVVNHGAILRVRVLAAAAVNAICHVLIEI